MLLILFVFIVFWRFCWFWLLTPLAVLIKELEVDELLGFELLCGAGLGERGSLLESELLGKQSKSLFWFWLCCCFCCFISDCCDDRDRADCGTAWCGSVLLVGTDVCLFDDMYVASYGGNLDSSVSTGGAWCWWCWWCWWNELGCGWELELWGVLRTAVLFDVRDGASWKVWKAPWSPVVSVSLSLSLGLFLSFKGLWSLWLLLLLLVIFWFILFGLFPLGTDWFWFWFWFWLFVWFWDLWVCVFWLLLVSASFFTQGAAWGRIRLWMKLCSGFEFWKKDERTEDSKEHD